MPDGLKVYLRSERLGDERSVDSTVTSGGRFVLTGKVDDPRFCSLEIERRDARKSYPKTQEVWVENADIRLTRSWDSLEYNDAAVTGRFPRICSMLTTGTSSPCKSNIMSCTAII